MVDYPFPLSDRDYVVKFERILEKNSIIYRFNSDTDHSIPINEYYIRLNNAAGEWRLTDIGNGLTEVSYIWNGELKGSAPMWVLKRSWIRQGNEIMINLKGRLQS